MNTQEINGSSWPTSYYVAAAVPLTVLSVLLPLTAFWLLDLAIRVISTSRARQVLKWVVIGASLVPNITLDILALRYSIYLPGIMDIGSRLILPVIASHVALISTYSKLLQNMRDIFRARHLHLGITAEFIMPLGALGKKTWAQFSWWDICWSLFSITAIVTYVYLVALAPYGYELIPYGVYFGAVSGSWLWEQRSSKLKGKK